MSTELSPTRTPIVLASQSKIRALMLENARVPFVQTAARIDEEAIRSSLSADGVSSRDQADALADLKAGKVSNNYPDKFVVGSDQILDLNGKALGKAESPDALKAQLADLSAKRHSLFSAVVVYEAGKPVWRYIGEARLTMHPLSDAFIDDYVVRNWDEVRFSVGGYHIENEGIRLFSRIQGSYFDILGLPLPELLSYLRTRKVFTT